MAGIKYLGADGNYHIVGAGGGADEVYIGPELPTGGQKIWINTSKDSSYGAGLEMVKLWENASPTSDFAAQSITVDLNGYQEAEIAWSLFVNSDGKITRCFNESYLSALPAQSGAVGCMATRAYEGYTAERFLTLSDDTISFGNAVRYNNYAGSYTQLNSLLIPLAIYGIKGVE